MFVDIETTFLRYKRLDWKLKTLSPITFLSLFLLLVFSLCFLNPLSYCMSPPFIGTFPFLISPAGLLLTRFRGCLSHHPSALPFFHHETGLFGVFLLFKLVYKHLMWKRLGRGHLINAEVIGSVVLISS